MIRIFYSAFLIAFFVIGVNGQFPAGFGWVFPRESPSANVTQTVGVTEISIKYHRPFVRNRHDEAIVIAEKVAKGYRGKNLIRPAEQVEKLIDEWKKLKQ